MHTMHTNLIAPTSPHVWLASSSMGQKTILQLFWLPALHAQTKVHCQSSWLQKSAKFSFDNFVLDTKEVTQMPRNGPWLFYHIVS